MENNEFSTNRVIWIAIGISVAVLVLAFGVAMLLFLFGVGREASLELPGTMAEFGDAYGVANAVVSALAFGAIVYAIFLQREDIRLQRQDLRTQQEMLRASIDEAAGTRKATTAMAEAHSVANSLEWHRLRHELGIALDSRMQADEEMSKNTPNWHRETLALMLQYYKSAELILLKDERTEIALSSHSDQNLKILQDSYNITRLWAYINAGKMNREEGENGLQDRLKTLAVRLHKEGYSSASQNIQQQVQRFKRGIGNFDWHVSNCLYIAYDSLRTIASN